MIKPLEDKIDLVNKLRHWFASDSDVTLLTHPNKFLENHIT